MKRRRNSATHFGVNHRATSWWIDEATNIRSIIPSGVALLDDWLTGVRAGGSHLLTGGPGSGKSALALHFADAGLRLGEPVAMLVHTCAEDLAAHAAFMGIDLDAPLRDGRLLLLRYRSEFLRRAAHAPSPEHVVADLYHVIAPHRPARLVVDTISPFVSGAPPLAPVTVALVDMIERLAATTMLTFPEDVSVAYDRSLEPIMQHTAAVIRLTRENEWVRRADVLNLRYPPPSATTMRFLLRQGIGVVAEHPVRDDALTLRVP